MLLKVYGLPFTFVDTGFRGEHHGKMPPCLRPDVSFHDLPKPKGDDLVVTRLQLGVSRLENLDDRVLPIFLDKTWIHFGDLNHEHESSPLKKLCALLRRHSLRYLINKTFQKLFINKKKYSLSNLDVDKMYSQTNFRDFVYQKGDRLPFENDSMDFIFSEHFFEHLFLDESIALLRECYRIMKPSGVIRTCVPDADLRTYEPPEPIGFPDINHPFTSPDKHKTRWSVYSLVEAIEIAGFKAIPLHYCNKSGEYIKVQPSNIENRYKDCPEQELIFDITYIMRTDSLIVDGVKEALKCGEVPLARVSC